LSVVTSRETPASGLGVDTTTEDFCADCLGYFYRGLYGK
jgi:hypothetical protein